MELLGEFRRWVLVLFNFIVEEVEFARVEVFFLGFVVGFGRNFYVLVVISSRFAFWVFCFFVCFFGFSVRF